MLGGDGFAYSILFSTMVGRFIGKAINEADVDSAGQFELGDNLKKGLLICRHLQQFSKIISPPNRPLPAAR
jgi:hypothetical protein